jgi:5-formyltetrahydrofolate cyclo-ligase
VAGQPPMASGLSLVEEKRALRRAMRAERERVAPDERGRMGQGAGTALLGLPELAAARVFSAYVPTRGELDVSFVVEQRVRAGATVVYPRVAVEAPRLRFHVVVPETPMVLGAYGILEPPTDAPEIPAEAIDLVLVPGLAFDAQGRRLGYGGGYYDELAQRLRAHGRGFLVGLGYDFQVVERIPAGETDAALDCLVTDARVLRFEGKPP